MIRVINLTNFFNRELWMYSLGDIKFKKPIALKKVAYVTLFLIIWTVPLVLTFGIPTGPVTFFIFVVIPVLAGNVASKPVFGGKGLIDFLKTAIGYIQEPKGWLDLRNSNKLDTEVFYVDNEIWLSRRRELELLRRESENA